MNSTVTKFKNMIVYVWMFESVKLMWEKNILCIITNVLIKY